LHSNYKLVKCQNR